MWKQIGLKRDCVVLSFREENVLRHVIYLFIYSFHSFLYEWFLSILCVLVFVLINSRLHECVDEDNTVICCLKSFHILSDWWRENKLASVQTFYLVLYQRMTSPWCINKQLTTVIALYHLQIKLVLLSGNNYLRFINMYLIYTGIWYGNWPACIYDRWKQI